MRAVQNSKNLYNIFPDAVHHDVWQSSYHQFPRVLFTACSSALRKPRQQSDPLVNSDRDTASRLWSATLLNVIANPCQIFDSP